jgi:dihydroorotate dehydrogenase (fumarate)
VTVERRIANRLYVRVSGKLQPVLTISSFAGAYHSGWNPLDGSITVTSTVTNAGNVALEGTATLTAGTWFGLGVGQLSRAELPEILPGNTSTVSYEITGVPQVGYAVVSLLVQGGISGDAPDPGPLPVITRDAFVLAVPWLLLLVIAAAAGVWLLLRWKRGRDDAYAVEWLAHAEAEAKLKSQGAHPGDQPLAMAGEGVHDEPAGESR